MDDKDGNLSKSISHIITEIHYIIEQAKKHAIRSVDFERVQMYWKIGERIVTEEQANQNRAEYGKYIVENLAKTLSLKYGSGFSKRVIYQAIQFYKMYPIVNALRAQLNWLQYKLLSSISDVTKREYYELEAVKNNWTGRELERQINAQLYERLLISNDRESVMEIAREERLPENAKEIIKDPMFLEFLGLEKKTVYRENDLEAALIGHLEKFLLELGNGFTFVARQKRITLEDDEFFIDLVFYNRLLKAHVVMEIKTHKLTHEDLGQLQTYVNYYDRNEKLVDENPTIGVLLCTAKNDALVQYALPEDNKTILASQYHLVLPSAEELLAQISEVEQEFQYKQEVNND